MFDTFNGLPLHPLVVHGVVVLLPLAILGTVLIAVRPRWRTRFGPLVVVVALMATVLVPIATSSGESLEQRVGDPGKHAGLGDQLLWFAIALLLASAALVALQWGTERAHAQAGAHHVDGTGDQSGVARSERTWLTVVATIAVVAALACCVQVYRVGDSGARAAWGDVGPIATDAIGSTFGGLVG